MKSLSINRFLKWFCFNIRASCARPPTLFGVSQIAPIDYGSRAIFALLIRNGRQWMRFHPQRTSSNDRIDTNLVPPCSFITRPMDLPMMSPAQRDGELIAHLTTQRAVLHKAQVMGIRGSAGANQAGLSGHMSNVLSVANPTR